MNELAAGRELDALIAERVFGRRVVARDWPCYVDFDSGMPDPCLFAEGEYAWWGDPPAFMTPDSREPVTLLRPDDPWPPALWAPTHETAIEPVDVDRHWAHVVLVPRYSTEIAEAWEVVERLCAGGWGVLLGDGWAGMATAWTARFVAFDPQTRREGAVTAPTMPLAICRAALVAVGYHAA